MLLLFGVSRGGSIPKPLLGFLLNQLASAPCGEPNNKKNGEDKNEAIALIVSHMVSL